MARKSSEETPVEKAEEKLIPFSVIIDGHDRTVFARDEEDLQRRLEKLRSI